MKKIFSILILAFALLFNSNTHASGFSAASYILIEENSGRILLEGNAHEKMPMASTTKIMTALVAIENGNLEDIVEIDEKCINVEGSSIYLKEGEKIILIDLLYGLMLRSGNDSAVAIANHIGGSEEEFIAMMNKKAKEIGAVKTNFTNPHGLHDENHYTTAYDMALITREAFKHEEFEEISATKSYTSDREKDNYFLNKNKTLWEYEGGDGGKTGYTMASGRCLVSSARREDMRLIAVSLNAPNWFNDNYKLMDYGFENYKLYSVYEKGQLITLKDIKNATDEKIPLVPQGDFIYPLKDEEVKGVKLSFTTDEKIEAPVYKDDVFGKIEVFLDGKLIKKDNLLAKYDVEKESIINRILQNFVNKVEYNWKKYK